MFWIPSLRALARAQAAIAAAGLTACAPQTAPAAPCSESAP